jgi:hypothetical protein
MSGFIAAERTGSLQFLEDLLLTCKSAFEAACKHDGIPSDTKFAVFSKDNPFVPFVNSGMAEYMQAKQDFFNLGYCGMVIKNGRAQLYKRPPKPRKKKATSDAQNNPVG